MQEISIKAFAALVNLTPARIYHQLTAGVLREKRKGILDKEAALIALIRFYQAATKSKAVDAGNGNMLDGKVARARLVSAQAEREELELSKARGELIAIDDHERILSEVVMATRARLLGIPSRSSAELVGLTSRNMALAIVEKHLHLALQDLAASVPAAPAAEEEPQAEPATTHAPSAPGAKATSKAPKPKAKSRAKAPTKKPAKPKAKRA